MIILLLIFSSTCSLRKMSIIMSLYHICHYFLYAVPCYLSVERHPKSKIGKKGQKGLNMYGELQLGMLFSMPAELLAWI